MRRCACTWHCSATTPDGLGPSLYSHVHGAHSLVVRFGMLLGSLPHVIEPGDEPPDFALPDQDGNLIKLSDLRGKPTVVYFYPKAATPGCTVQACGVHDHQAGYAKAGAVVLGISPDGVAKVKKFHEKEALNFPLLADEDHAVAEAYGVWVQKSMYGRTYWGNERTTFVIDSDGRIAQVLRKVKPAEHDKLALAALGAS